ncbi:glycosyltransferase [Alkalicoccobacillus porphyridii]|uniref:Glycosyltransferase n=1 Tax=Alkalicoccobacillus porphyridii TaxID=2597270 RepID=A0A554A3V5_9BACI|nr:glycosyltransferase [Alkalicoccobacillus porphyridii]TSB48372.1 glycosyltransferase [Alkalicoccobacillus porphyridii]
MNKIAFILYSLEGGGVERMTLHLAEGFLNKGYVVDLLVIQLKGEYVQDIPDGINIIDLNKSNLRSSVGAIRSYLKAEKPDTIISAKDYINSVVLLANLLSGTKTKTIVSCRVNLTEQARREPSFNKVKRSVSLLYRFATHIVGVSQGVADDIQRISKVPSKRVHVIYNPVVTPALMQKGAEKVEHPWFSNEYQVAVTVGRLHIQKDYQTLLQSMSYIEKKNSAFRLIIVGDGPEREQLIEQAHQLKVDHLVDFIGFRSNPYPYMKKAKLFVLSSAWEGFGNVLVEALAMGTPIVSTDCPSGPAEILDDGRYGRLVTVGAENQLAEAMLATLESHPPEQELKERANQFSLEHCLDAYERLLLNK